MTEEAQPQRNSFLSLSPLLFSSLDNKIWVFCDQRDSLPSSSLPSSSLPSSSLLPSHEIIHSLFNSLSSSPSPSSPSSSLSPSPFTTISIEKLVRESGGDVVQGSMREGQSFRVCFDGLLLLFLILIYLFIITIVLFMIYFVFFFLSSLKQKVHLTNQIYLSFSFPLFSPLLFYFLL